MEEAIMVALISAAVALISAAFAYWAAMLNLQSQRHTAMEQKTTQFRLAALDKRLEVHQQAFVHCRDMTTKLHDDLERRRTVIRCEEWWDFNCLYLDPGVRDLFRECLFGVFNYDGKDAQKREEVWPKLMELPKRIFSAVSLPPIGGEEDTLGKSLRELYNQEDKS